MIMHAGTSVAESTSVHRLHHAQVLDQTFSMVGDALLSVLSEPAKLVKILCWFFALALAYLLLGNATTVSGSAVTGQTLMSSPRALVAVLR